MHKKSSIFLLWITLLVLSLTFIVLHLMFINWDTAWHVIAAGRMLDGATYTSQLWDDNSPLVFAIYIPISLFFKITHGPSPGWVSCYILILLALSLFGCWQALKSKNLLASHKTQYYAVSLCTLTLIALIIFGQREHLMFAFYLPYLFLQLFSSSSISDKRPIKSNVILHSGLAIFAAIGFVQQPMYIIIPIALDVYNKIFQKECVSPYVRRSFYLSLIIILLLAAWLYPNYYLVVLPLVIQFQSGLNQSWSVTFDSTLLFLSLAIWAIVTTWNFIYRKDEVSFKLSLASALGFIIYFIEFKIWYYHLYWAISLTLLLWYHSVFLLFKSSEVNKGKICSGSVMIFLSYLPCTLFLLLYLLAVAGNIAYYADRNTVERQMITYATAHLDNRRVFMLTPHVSPTYILPFYSSVKIVTPWSNNWMLPGLVDQVDKKKWGRRNAVGRRWLFQLICDTLIKQQPDFVMYRVGKPISYITNKNFHYKTFLKKNSCVRMQLTHYKPVKTFVGFEILKRYRK